MIEQLSHLPGQGEPPFITESYMQKLAKEALRSAKRSGGVTVSRDADKFVIRLPEGMRDQLDARAVLDGQSMNSVAVEALTNHLAVRNEQQIILEALQLLKKQLEEAIANVKENDDGHAL